MNKEDIDELIILIRNEKYIIKPQIIEHYQNREIIKLISRDIILKSEFYAIKDIVLDNIQYWKEEFCNSDIKEKSWSIIIKNNNIAEEYCGYKKFPEKWEEFLEKIILLVEKTDTLDLDEIFIIQLITKLTTSENEPLISNIIKDIYEIKTLDIIYMSKELLEIFNELSDIQFLKLMIETKKILEFYIKKYPKKDKIEFINKTKINIYETFEKYGIKPQGELNIENNEIVKEIAETVSKNNEKYANSINNLINEIKKLVLKENKLDILELIKE